MPGPVPKHITGFSGGALNLVNVEPLLMAHVAAVAVAWTEIERALTNSFSAMLGASQFQDANHTVVQFSGNRVASIIMGEAETIRQRIKFMDAAVQPLLKDTPFEAQWTAIRDDLKKRSRERNEIVHANWFCTSELPNYLVRLRGANHERWNVADFQQVQRRFHALHMSIRQLTHDFGSANASGHRP